MKKTIVVLLVCAFCGTFVTPLALAQGQSSSYQRGYMEGKGAAEEDINRLVEGFWGFLWGPVAVLWGVVNQSEMSASRAMLLENKSTDYKKGFRKGYVETMNNSTLISRTVGWSTWLIFFLLG